jgi:hypothetical protein
VHATMPSKTLLLRPTKGCFASEAFAHRLPAKLPQGAEGGR